MVQYERRKRNARVFIVVTVLATCSVETQYSAARTQIEMAKFIEDREITATTTCYIVPGARVVLTYYIRDAIHIQAVIFIVNNHRSFRHPGILLSALSFRLSSPLLRRLKAAYGGTAHK